MGSGELWVQRGWDGRVLCGLTGFHCCGDAVLLRPGLVLSHLPMSACGVHSLKMTL